MIEAKEAGTAHSVVAEQSATCGASRPDFLATLVPGTESLPFAAIKEGLKE